MSRFYFPQRALHSGHPGPLAWFFFWWLLIPIYLLWLAMTAVFFIVLLPVNIVRLLTTEKPKQPLCDMYTGERLR